MCFDFSVLLVASAALLRFGHEGSSLWRLLFVDGILYFLSKSAIKGRSCSDPSSLLSTVVFACYLTCTIIAFIDNNVALALMLSDSATIIARIAACRSFLRVGTYTFDS